MFEYCSSLSSVTIPAGVTRIGSHAFFFCEALSKVTFLGNAPAIGANVFLGASSGFAVYYLNSKVGFTSPTWNGYKTVNMGDLSPIAIWLISNGLPADSILQADPNRDGVNLLMAYALNLDPAENLSGSLPRPVIAGNQLCFTFYAGSEGVTYTVLSSADLKEWKADKIVLSPLDASKFRTASVSMLDSQCFMRLVVAY
jgi:hypothetical protein